MDPFKFANYPMWVKYLVFLWLALSFALAAVGLFVRLIDGKNKPTSGTAISDAKLVIDAKRLSRDISEFANHRQGTEPVPEKERWEESTNKMIRHSQETSNYYLCPLKIKTFGGVKYFSIDCIYSIKTVSITFGFFRFADVHPLPIVGCKFTQPPTICTCFIRHNPSL